MYNFADDTSLSAIAKTHAELKHTLQSESEVVINWFKNDKRIVNPEKFQAIILDKPRKPEIETSFDKQKHDYSNETIEFDNKIIETVSSASVLGVQLGYKLNFSLHVSNICKSAANQLSALIKLNNFLCFEGKRVFINSILCQISIIVR